MIGFYFFAVGFALLGYAISGSLTAPAVVLMVYGALGVVAELAEGKGRRS